MYQLQKLKDKDLAQEISRLVKQENKVRVEILWYLSELNKRKLYLELGYNSLFAFCREKLKYSEGAAMRRIVAAKAIARFEQIGELLEQRKLSLSTVSLVANILTEENYQEIL